MSIRWLGRARLDNIAVTSFCIISWPLTSVSCRLECAAVNHGAINCQFDWLQHRLMYRTYIRCSVLSLWPPSLERDKMFLEKKRWSPSNSHSSLLDQYWSAGKAAAVAERFMLAFYCDDRGVWPDQRLKAFQSAGGSIICHAQTWWLIRYTDASIIWKTNFFVYSPCGLLKKLLTLLFFCGFVECVDR